MSQINVIRPFVYTRKPPKGLKVPVERWFKVGAGQEIDDEMAADPFISVRFADGCIENPEQAQERARIATEKAARIQREADEANRFAKQAYDRAVAAAKVGGKLRRDEPSASAPAPLRTDGPTLEEWVKAGYKAENYPPEGYAARVTWTPQAANAGPASPAPAGEATSGSASGTEQVAESKGPAADTAAATPPPAAAAPTADAAASPAPAQAAPAPNAAPKAGKR